MHFSAYVLHGTAVAALVLLSLSTAHARSHLKLAVVRPTDMPHTYECMRPLRVDITVSSVCKKYGMALRTRV